MHLPRFEYERLHSPDDAGRLLGRYGADARLVAGGTDLYPRMKYGLLRPRMVLDLKGLPFKPPMVDGRGALHLDAVTTLATLIQDTLVREKAPLLADAARSVGSVQVRERATIGGNICLENRCLYYNQSHTFQFIDPCFKRGGDQCYLVPGGKRCLAVFCADTVPALIALDAAVAVGGPGGRRQMPLEQLYTGDGVKPLALAPDELIAEVIVPEQPKTGGGAFAKFSVRGGVEFAAVTVAATLTLADDGIACAAAAIIAGAVAAAPRRARQAGQVLQGHGLSPALLDTAARKACEEISPVPHHGFSASYLRACLEVQVRRALQAAEVRMPRRL